MIAAMMTVAAMNVNAGGLLTNTNQSAAFVRQMSSNAVIDITSLYTNPAGTAFLSDGWHFALTSQTAIQERDIETTFPLFALNTNNKNLTHEFKGKALAPIIPSFQLSYNKEKWSVNAAFAITGGGGKCEFERGLGSFEALYSGQLNTLVPQMVKQTVAGALPGIVKAGVASKLTGMGISPANAEMLANMTQVTPDINSNLTGYSLDAYMKGRQYYFGFTIGGTYKVRENLSAYLGLRTVYATCNYNGFVQDVKADYSYTANYTYKVPGNPALGLPDINGEDQSSDTGSQDLSANALALNCEQVGWGFTPIIGIDWKINDQWNVAAKYEFKTRMRLENESEMNNMAEQQAAQEGNVLAQFADGKKVAEDIPGVFALGVQYSPIEQLRLNAGLNVYLDKDATKYGDKHKLIDHNSHEVTFGAEYDINKMFTVSGSWQNTSYGLSDAYMNDLSFNLSSNSLGLGVRMNVTERTSIDLGYMHTMYKDRTVETQVAPGVVKKDNYNRKNDVLAIGVSIAF